jgi:hypothetical protein
LARSVNSSQGASNSDVGQRHAKSDEGYLRIHPVLLVNLWLFNHSADMLQTCEARAPLVLPRIAMQAGHA